MKKVVIIGGSFAGSKVAKILEKSFSVTLIDKKSYFEFIPSILSCAVNKNFESKIRVNHKDYLKKTRIILGEVAEIRDSFVILKNKKINFDYLVIVSGAKYAPSDRKKGIISAGDSKELINSYYTLKKSKDVVIIGGGLVGVELAGEICSKYKDKNIFILNRGEKVISRNHPKAIAQATKFLEKKGVRMIMNSNIIEKKGKSFITDKNEIINADIAYNCIGATPNTNFMKKNFSKHLNEKGSIKVNDFLHLEGLPNIFAGGDVTAINEEKTAQSAEKQAEVICNNIIALVEGKSLEKYEPKKRAMLISLGRRRAIFDNGKIVFSGIIPALMKIFVEKRTLLSHR